MDSTSQMLLGAGAVLNHRTRWGEVADLPEDKLPATVGYPEAAAVTCWMCGSATALRLVGERFSCVNTETCQARAWGIVNPRRLRRPARVRVRRRQSPRRRHAA